MKTAPPHIRLVVSEPASTQVKPEKVTVGKRRPKRGEQLKLDLESGRDEKRVVLVAMGSIHGHRFTDLIVTIKPNIVLDTRHAIRFDLPGTDRSYVFAKLNAVSAFYAKASIPWHDLKAADFMADRGPISQRLHHEILERAEKRIMVLLPDIEHLSLLRSYLNRQLSGSANNDWRVEEVV